MAQKLARSRTTQFLLGALAAALLLTPMLRARPDHFPAD
jgi:hypothetical protein